jgi:hypothetical protein
MVNKLESCVKNFAAMRELFGSPPVLSTENQKAYDDLTMQLLQDFRPHSFIEMMYIRQLADHLGDRTLHAP